MSTSVPVRVLPVNVGCFAPQLLEVFNAETLLKRCSYSELNPLVLLLESTIFGVSKPGAPFGCLGPLTLLLHVQMEGGREAHDEKKAGHKSESPSTSYWLPETDSFARRVLLKLDLQFRAKYYNLVDVLHKVS